MSRRYQKQKTQFILSFTPFYLVPPANLTRQHITSRTAVHRADCLKRMARVGILFGVLLCALTGVALVLSMSKATSQFFPMMLGIPVLFCGVVGLNPHRRRASLLTAAGICLLGLLVGAGHLVSLVTLWNAGAEISFHTLRIVSVMSAFCLIFVGMTIRWFFTLPPRVVAIRSPTTDDSDLKDLSSEFPGSDEMQAGEKTSSESKA